MFSDLSGFTQGDERPSARRDADVVNDDGAGLQPVEPQPNRSKLRRVEVWRRLDEIDERKHVGLKHHLVLGREPLRFLVASTKDMDLKRSPRHAESAERQARNVAPGVGELDGEIHRSGVFGRLPAGWLRLLTLLRAVGLFGRVARRRARAGLGVRRG